MMNRHSCRFWVFPLASFCIGSLLSSLGWAAPKPTPKQTALQEEEQLRRQYMSLHEQGSYEEAFPLALRACEILEKELGKRSKEYAGCLGDLGMLYDAQGKYEKAEPFLRRALLIRKKLLGSKHLDVAKGLTGLAVLHYHRGEYEKAESLLMDALIIQEKLLGREHPDIADTLNNLATLYQSQGNHDKAEEFYERALRVYEVTLGTNRLLLANCLGNLADVLVTKEEYGRAGLLLEQAQTIYEDAAPKSPLLASLLDKRGLLLLKQEEHEAARLSFERGLSIRKSALGTDHPDIANSWLNLAGLHHELGEDEKAESLFKRALSIEEQALGPNHPHVAQSLLNLAEAHRAQGEYGSAEPCYERALRIWEDTLGAEHLYVAIGLSSLASLYTDQGEYGKALPLFERALSIIEKVLGPESSHTAFVLNGLARAYGLNGEHEKAIPRYERALSIYESTFGPAHHTVATVLSNLGVEHTAQQEYDKAEPLLRRAHAILETSRGVNHLHMVGHLIVLGDLYHNQGDYGKAASYYEQALLLGERSLGPEHPHVALALNRLASLSIKQGHYESAVELQARSLGVEEQNSKQALVVAEESRRLSISAKLFQSAHYTLSLHLQVVPNDRTAAELALATLLRRKGRAQDLVAQSYTTLRRTLSEDDQQILDDLASTRSRYSTLIHRGQGEHTIGSHRKQLADFERKQDALWAELVRLSPRARALDELVTVPDIQTRLAGDACLIEYVRYRAVYGAGTSMGTNEERYAAYIVFPNGFEWVDLGSSDVIDEQVRSFRDAILRKADAEDPGRALYDSIMKPMIDHLGSANGLFIAPDGDLNLVPFDALVDEYDNYLVERFRLYYLTSGRDLLRPWRHEPVADGSVVVVANPKGADLPSTEREAELLASLFSGTVTMHHEDATETRLRVNERPRILHLATHGTFGTGRPGHTLLATQNEDELSRLGNSVFDGLPPTQLDNPMLYSWLDLAPPPTPAGEIAGNDADLDDGKLTAYEVSGWDLRGTELVTLSACDTAQGTYQEGEGILGLRRAFAVAGAQTQVMSLWKVSDTSTAKLMESYYRRLLAGEGRSEAMRNTQLDLLRNPETRHPRDWAAFVVVGEWAPLDGIAREGPEPLPPRPRACQASTGFPFDGSHPLATLVFLVLFARRRARAG